MFTILTAFPGEKQYFFDGADNSSYGCSCGKNGTCLSLSGEENFCHCDARSASLQQDEGVITAMQLLPIQEFAYGPYSLEGNHPEITMGKLYVK